MRSKYASRPVGSVESKNNQLGVGVGVGVGVGCWCWCVYMDMELKSNGWSWLGVPHGVPFSNQPQPTPEPARQ